MKNNILSFLFVVICFFSIDITKAQKYDETSFQRLDSLAVIGEPRAAQQLVGKMYNYFNDHDDATLSVKAAIYRMIFQVYLDENATDSILIGLKSDIQRAKQPQKSILQSILAHVYRSYLNQNQYRISQRTNLESSSNEGIETWSIGRLNEEIKRNYLLSIHEAELLQKVKLRDMGILIKGDTATREYRPTLYDMLAHRAIDAIPYRPFNQQINDSIQLQLRNTDLFNPSFLSAVGTRFDLPIVKIYLELIRFHQSQGNRAALADIKFSFLKFIKNNTRLAGYGLYEKNLEQLAEDVKQTPVYADILFEQATLIKNKSIPKDSATFLIQAVQLAEKAMVAHPGSAGARNCENLIREIKAKQFNFSIRPSAQPDRAIPVLINYTNVDSVQFKFYKVGIRTAYLNIDFNKFLENKTPYRIVKITLPSVNDYLSHSYLDKIEGLPMGSYILEVKVIDAGASEKLRKFTKFTQSNIFASYRKLDDKVVFQISRAVDGTPIKDARIQRGTYTTTTVLDEEAGHSDQSGLVSMNKNNSYKYALVIYQNDTTIIPISNYRYFEPVQRKKVVFFTDRSIYRPGQLVYFKGILLSSTQNKSEIWSHEKVKVSFKDVNWKVIKEVDLSSNEFGSFQGSFVIPTGLLNGIMRIESEHGSIDFQVEEYKRPTFEVVFDKADQRYKQHDSVTVKGKVVSFAGYGMSGAKVNYKVTLTRLFQERDYNFINPDNLIIANNILIAKSGGDFEIKFLPKLEQITGNYTLRIDVETTANNGETRRNTTQIIIGSKDILGKSLFPTSLILNEKRDTLRYQIANLNGQPIKASVTTQWNLLKAPDRLTNRFEKAEKYGLTRAEFIKVFPLDEYNDENNIAKWAIEKNILTRHYTSDASGTAQFTVNEKDLPTGYYRLKSTIVNAQQDTLVQEQTIRVYNQKPEQIILANEWLLAEKNNIQRFEKAKFRISGLTKESKVYYEVYYQNRIEKQAWIKVSPKQTLVEFETKPYYKDSFAIQFFMICEGTVYSSLQTVTIADPKQQLDIRFLSFRDKLQPGEKETWKLKINNKAGEKELAEMVATLYDASLDSFRPLSWSESLTYPFSYHHYNWIYNPTLQNQYVFGYSDWYPTIRRNYEQLNLFGFNGVSNGTYRQLLQALNQRKERDRKLAELAQSKLIYGLVSDRSGPIHGLWVKIGKELKVATDEFGIYSLEVKEGTILTFSGLGLETKTVIVGKKRRIDVVFNQSSSFLQEVVVSGNSAPNKEMSVGSSIKISGKDRPSASTENLFYSREENAAGLNVNQKITLRGHSSVSGVNDFDGFSNRKIAVRSDFSETAFFYPQLQTNEKGEIDLSFTIPQSLTRYTMRGFAHTKDLKTASITNQLITQKQVAVSMSAPRFFREADTIWLSATVNNLSGKILKGNVMLVLKDALTGNPIQLSQTPQLIQFKIDDNGSETLKWQLVIPSQISALTCKVLAEAGKYTDGEEITIPVLPNRILMTESMPFHVKGHSSKTFEMDKLIKSASSNTLQTQSLTLEYTANPAWYAVQALPYLMEYPYECAEQTFSRFFANSFATGIVNSSPQIKQVFEQWQHTNKGAALLSNLEKNAELKTILLEETPWVRQAENEADRKKRIATLFDLNRMSYELKGNFDKLAKMQLSNGAFPWFAGMSENRYITQHILMGFGKLQKADLINEKELVNYKSLVNKAIIYLDNELIADYKKELNNKGSDRLALHYLLARSYFNHQNSNPVFKLAFMYYLRKIKANWITMDTYQQAQAALVLMRNGEKETALKIITLLKQTAQYNEEMGMYWPTNNRGWWWYQSPVETQALLIIAFDEIANDQLAVEQMKIWLLKNKQTNDWKNTKTTAEACYALLMKGDNLLQNKQALTIQLGNADIGQFKQPNSTTEAGTGYEKVSILADAVQPVMGKVSVKNENKGIAWGALYWQYFEQLDKITPSNTGIKIEKQLFLQKETENGKLLTTLNSLKVGDLVKVRIVIKADRDMEYLHLKDMRSAGFEPVNVISSYKFQDGLGYYESTKDAATNFFISYLPKGTYVFEYPLRVSHAGSFSNGVTSMQSMYAPEFTTYSQGIRVNVK